MVVGKRNMCINVNDKDMYIFGCSVLETVNAENSENGA